MPDTNDDSKQPSKKIHINDFSGNEPSTAPDLQDVPEEKPDAPTDVEKTTDEMKNAEGAQSPETPADAHTDTDPNADSNAAPDPKTDTAVDDIMKKDGDEALRAQDATSEKTVVMKSGHGGKFKNWLAGWWGSPRKRWTTIIAVVVVIAAVFAVPFTRYNALGLALSGQVTVRAVDSKTGKPVSGASVALAGKTAETNADGVAVLKVHAGSKTLQVSKKYYTGVTQSQLVALSGNSFKAALVATGHQVNVKVTNKITGKIVTGATVTAGGAKAKTNANGLATLVIASDATTQQATVALAGYNTATVTITATGNLAKNSFSITPAGKLYFLSNLSGKIDVVKTDLDGTNRQTVLAGTGSEDGNSTSLLASRDWKYLALLSKRSGDKPSVYLIDTTSGDKLSTIDEGNASFTLVGWSGDRFVYQVTRTTVQQWQPNKQALKSFDPTTGHTLLLDQTQASGTDDDSYAAQSFGTPYVIDDQVVYAKNWNGSYHNLSLMSGKQAELDTITAAGSGHKVVKLFGSDSSVPTASAFVDTALYEPDGIYVSFAGSTPSEFYDYDGGKLTSDTSLTQDKFYNTSYSTHLFSPSGSATFWSEQRDGKNTLFTGDASGKSPKQVAALSDYNTYAWYTDDYLLVSKNSSELYILPVTGGTPQKVTDYYKPAINYAGYGGGYGGL